MFALHDIRSYNGSLLYAEQGEQVIIVSTNQHVLICEAKRGRFPCTSERLTDTVPEKIIEPLRAPKSNDKDQLNMFGL